jgi:hypothetical protein
VRYIGIVTMETSGSANIPKQEICIAVGIGGPLNVLTNSLRGYMKSIFSIRRTHGGNNGNATSILRTGASDSNRGHTGYNPENT